MEVPTNARDVAWFDQGPLPGRTNNVVLAGHIDYNGFETKLDYARTLGLEYVVCPMLPEQMWNSVDGYKRAAQQFNTKRESFPTVLVAGFFGSKFAPKPYFQGQAGSEKAPEVKF